MVLFFAMIPLRSWFLIVGVVLLLLGVGCLPLGPGISPKRDLSAFERLVDTGYFFEIGLKLMAAGVLVIVLTGLGSLLADYRERRRLRRTRGGNGSCWGKN